MDQPDLNDPGFADILAVTNHPGFMETLVL